MTEELIIHDGKVYLKEYKTTKVIDLQELATNIVQIKKDIETPQLPLNTIKYKTDGKNHFYYILIPEDNYNLTYLTKSYTVRLPHTIIRFKFEDSPKPSSIKMFWSMDKEINLKSKNFYIPPLSNIYTDGGICMGDYQQGKTPSESIINYINSFFTNVFNNDLNGGKKLISSVALEQQKAIKLITDEHELIKLWWYKLDEKDKITETSLVNSRYLEGRSI